MTKISKILLILVILVGISGYAGSYAWFRDRNVQLWEQDINEYLIFPNTLSWYFYRPAIFVDDHITDMRFHVGPHAEVAESQERHQITPVMLPLGEGTTVQINPMVDKSMLVLPTQTFQTFNNCGPATLSMMFAYYGISKTQAELGQLIRPFQNQRGDNDDKSTAVEEYVEWANEFGLEGVLRPNGDIDLLKSLVTNNFPVVVRTWLNKGGDISHYRIIIGFDDVEQVIIQSDSYHGKGLKISYTDFMSMWKPFNYEFVVLYEKEREATVKAILGKDFDTNIAFGNALERAMNDLETNSEDVYARFNAAISYFHLGLYVESVTEFENVENILPKKMLWYQFEPIQAYQKLGDRDRVFAMTDKIFASGNRAFSELYQIRGEFYMAEGDYNSAKNEFETALIYKNNYKPALSSLAILDAVR